MDYEPPQIPILDKGYIRIISSMGDDTSVIRSARVSYDMDYNEYTMEKGTKLINYLWNNGHTTPFESVAFTFEIKAPIFVFRQWHRHRTQSYNEVSARYTELEDEFYVPDPVVIGEQSTKTKQARFVDPTAVITEDVLRTVGVYENGCIASFERYKHLLEQGWPRELARMVLPLSTYSRMFATANLLNWFRFIELRTHPHAQWEIQQYAKAIEEVIQTYVPVCVNAFRNKIEQAGVK